MRKYLRTSFQFSKKGYKSFQLYAQVCESTTVHSISCSGPRFGPKSFRPCRTCSCRVAMTSSSYVVHRHPVPRPLASCAASGTPRTLRRQPGLETAVQGQFLHGCSRILGNDLREEEGCGRKYFMSGGRYFAKKGWVTGFSVGPTSAGSHRGIARLHERPGLHQIHRLYA
jgi:hypothetical protein